MLARRAVNPAVRTVRARRDPTVNYVPGRAQAPGIGRALLMMLRTVAGLRARVPMPWTGSWTGPSVQPVRSGPSAARLRGIRAAGAHNARSRASHNPPVVGSSPTRPTSGSWGAKIYAGTDPLTGREIRFRKTCKTTQVRKVRGPLLDTLYTRLMRCGDLACTGKPFTEQRKIPDLRPDPAGPLRRVLVSALSYCRRAVSRRRAWTVALSCSPSSAGRPLLEAWGVTSCLGRPAGAGEGQVTGERRLRVERV
jgi:hypothetical protein